MTPQGATAFSAIAPAHCAMLRDPSLIADTSTGRPPTPCCSGLERSAVTPTAEPNPFT